MAWIYLVLAGLFEVGFTTCLRYVDGFRNLAWTGGFVVCVAVSMYLLDLATRSAIPLGTGYAVWTGIGAVGTVVIGMIWFGEPASALRIALILGLLSCIVGLKLTAGH
jgi:quaternary ammonium compound-resistance protein SugE